LRLKESRIAIAGLGGLYFIKCVRIGIEKFNLAEFDQFELGNFKRQVGANMEAIGKKIGCNERIKELLTLSSISLALSDDKVITIIKKRTNCSAVSVPLAFSELKSTNGIEETSGIHSIWC